MRKIKLALCTGVAFVAALTAYGQQADSVKGVLADPTATILGSDTDVCLGDSVEAYLHFTGNGPWVVVINDNEGEYLKLKDVEDEYYTIWLKPEEDDRYYIDYVEDRRGRDGKTYGEVMVSVFQSTPVSINLDRTAYLYSEQGVVLSSSPPGASFFGNGVAGFVFYPFIATPEGSPHLITATYINSFGCTSEDEINIHVLYGEGSVYLISGTDTINSLCDNGETYLISGSNLDNIPGLFELREAGSLDPLSGPITDEDPEDDLALLDPTGLVGLYDIIYSYEFQGLVVSMSFRFQVNDLGIVGISGLPDVVCRNHEPYPLVPELEINDPGAVYSFNGPGVSGNQADGFFYDPGNPETPVGENRIDMEYTSSSGCSTSFSQVVSNKEVPDVLFTLSPICLPAGGGNTSFENLTGGVTEGALWSWDFGDPSSGTNNNSNLENPVHFYTEPGEKQIGLTATTTDGCEVVYTLDTILIDQPVADFTWNNDCYIQGEKVLFIDRTVSNFSPLDSLIWTFQTSNQGVLDVIITESPDDTVEFLFSGVDSYVVDLQVHNKMGCSGDTTKAVILRTTRILSAAGLEEDFNAEQTEWFTGGEGLQTSWKLGAPDFYGFVQTPGDLAWYTDLPPDNGGYLEHSWVQSSCLDFSSSKNPFIQMDLMRSFVPGQDGAVMQYQDVVSEGWKTIGNLGEGINWYNISGLSNKPGQSDFGWGLSNLNPFNPDSDWVNATHDLDELAGLPIVKLRIVIATGGTREIESGRINQGFAFDNIVIGERIRRSLLEHFTNSASLECYDADKVADQFVSSQPGRVIDLQYHMDYPGVDPMNLNNPYPPSTRAFANGVQGVPFAVLNGGTGSDHRYDFSDPSSAPNETVLKQASLEVPVFDLELAVNWLENKLDAQIVTACRTDNYQSNIQLYVAVIESSVTAYQGQNQDTSFRNVVLDMLPTPAGKLLGDAWYNGKTDERSYSWDYGEYVEDIEDLAVVVFLQDRESREVLQVAAEFLTPGVGASFPLKQSRSMALYPNPAISTLYVNLGRRPVAEGELTMMDLSGKVLRTTEVHPGISLYQLDVAPLSAGLYMIYWVDEQGVQTREKLVIID